MALDHLWAGWRSSYIDSLTNQPAAREPATPGEEAPGDRLRGDPTGVPVEPQASLFERILELPDDEGLVVHRGRTGAVVLNAYPYTNGHVLVLPTRAVPTLTDLRPDEHTELWELVRDAVSAIERAYRCEGVNLGMNLGKAAGAGVPEHLHVHVLPRWAGDTNFMTAVAETRVLPEPLSVAWHKLRTAWP